NRPGGGHPAIHAIPGARALGEERALDGPRVIESLVAGYEVGSRLGGATTPRANVHSHGTWGAIATAVAVARLGDARAQPIREVINLAASMSPANSWTPALAGATIRNLYPGRSGLAGILAVDLQRCGFTGLDDAPSDVYATILGDRFDPALGDPRIRELAHRIEVLTESKMSPRRIDYPTAQVKVALRDGRILEETTTVPRGDAENPVPPEELVAKFLELASPVLGPTRARRVVEAAHAVETLKNVRELTALLAPE